MNFTFLFIPILSAFIGWLTNRVAIRMLFRPQKPLRILGIKIQGLVPARKKEMAQKFGEVIERDFLRSQDIAALLRKMELGTRLTGEIDRMVDERIANASISLMLLRRMPLLKRPLEAFVERVKRSVRNALNEHIESAAEEMVRYVQENVEIREIVRARIEAFETDYLEEVVLRLSRKELKAIEYWGGALGFVVGLVQSGVIFLIR
ncbi:MAG: DUF445 family protein [Candidatus Latescibacteria bacterium]|nr:DUF445 family protein [Candidatus Latescibacterota bacterium]MCK5527434.1 DUF445 family protein [Candidatus Latescibacterota bacterium]